MVGTVLIGFLATVSPFAPAQVISASEKAAAVASEKPGGGRARLPRARRQQGEIPGLVTYDYGKTASGERTRLYRIMGQGGVVADFTDYGARLIRCYVPDATGALSDLVADARLSALAAEKAGETAEVWRMRPVRMPRATGLVFTRETTNAAPSEVTYWLDAKNVLTVQTTLPDCPAVTNAAAAAASPAPCALRFKADPSRPFTVDGYASTTNGVTTVFTRPATNQTQKVTVNFKHF